MKWFTKSAVVMIIMGLMLMSMCIPVGAENYESDSEGFIGFDSDISGYLIPDNEGNGERSVDPITQIIYDDAGTAYYKIFSIRADRVTGLLTSNVGGKSFVRSDLPSNAKYILCLGELHHSLEDEIYQAQDIMYGGVCYYGYNHLYGEDTYNAICRAYPEADHSVEMKFTIAKIEPDTTYYSYVKNLYLDGYVYGTLTIYYSLT